MTAWMEDAPTEAVEIVAALADPVNEFIKLLGESPEAWRGAIEFVRLLSGISAATRQANLDHDQEMRLITSILLAMMMSFHEHDITQGMIAILDNEGMLS